MATKSPIKPSFSFLFLLFITIPFSTESKLNVDYYKTTCPEFQKIVRDTVTDKQNASPATAAAMLQTFLHDCFVEGCDASVLVATNAFNVAERDADINLALPGDAFDVVVRAKTALELSCPRVVSCADILAQATRDLVTIVGGPNYPIRLGRKDGFVSKSTRVGGNIPRGNMTMDQMVKLFNAKGFSVQEMVALSGMHTVGFSHCKEFADRLFSYNKTNPTDPDMNPKLASALKKVCANYTKDPTMAAFNDVMTSGKFDNMYFKDLLRGLGLLRTDQAFVKDPRTRAFVEKYAADQAAFFQDFSRAMEKLSRLGVKTGRKGEVRHRCDQFNFIQA